MSSYYITDLGTIAVNKTETYLALTLILGCENGQIHEEHIFQVAICALEKDIEVNKAV